MIDPTTLSTFAAATKRELLLDRFDLRLDRDGLIVLDRIVVPVVSRQRGAGSEAMRRLVAFADDHHARLGLSLANPSDGIGTSSRSRLIKFYKRFGFVENKGRARDFSVSWDMLREPRAARRTNPSDRPWIWVDMLRDPRAARRPWIWVDVEHVRARFIAAGHDRVADTVIVLDPSVDTWEKGERTVASCEADGSKIYLSPRIERFDEARRRALIAHELGHAVQGKYDTPVSRRDRHDEVERDADRIAEDVMGQKLYYSMIDGRLIQTFNPRDGVRPRPRGLE